MKLEVKLLNILGKTVSSYQQKETINRNIIYVVPSTSQFGKLIAFEIEFPQNNTDKLENWLPCYFSKLLCPVGLNVKIFGGLKARALKTKVGKNKRNLILGTFQRGMVRKQF